MKFRFLIKIPQHRKFDYKPRYYDKDMAEFHDRVLEKTSDQKAKIKFSRLEFDKKMNFSRSREDKVAERSSRYISLAFIILILAPLMFYKIIPTNLGYLIFIFAIVWRLQLLKLLANRIKTEE